MSNHGCGVRGLTALKYGNNIANDPTHVVGCRSSSTCDMRVEKCIGKTKQWVLGRKGFWVMHIKHGCCGWIASQELREGLMVEHHAATCVDEEHAGLHRTDEARIDEVTVGWAAIALGLA